MKASSFLFGVVIGAVASSWLAKGKIPMFSSGSSRMMDQAKHKMMEMTFPGMDGFSAKQNGHHDSDRNSAKKPPEPYLRKKKKRTWACSWISYEQIRMSNVK